MEIINNKKLLGLQKQILCIREWSLYQKLFNKEMSLDQSLIYKPDYIIKEEDLRARLHLLLRFDLLKSFTHPDNPQSIYYKSTLPYLTQQNINGIILQKENTTENSRILLFHPVWVHYMLNDLSIHEAKLFRRINNFIHHIPSIYCNEEGYNISAENFEGCTPRLAEENTTKFWENINDSLIGV